MADGVRRCGDDRDIPRGVYSKRCCLRSNPAGSPIVPPIVPAAIVPAIAPIAPAAVSPSAVAPPITPGELLLAGAQFDGVSGNVGIASVIYARDPSWWIAGLGGAVMGAVWNYVVSAAFVWRQR